MTDLLHWEQDPSLYLFTSLTSGSSHIVTATSRIETILKANKLPFKGVDTATDESAKKLYQRRGKNKKLPLLVKEGFVIADLAQVEEWNEYGELKEMVGPVPGAETPSAIPPPPPAHKHLPATISSITAHSKQTQSPEATLALRQASKETAAIAADKNTAKTTPASTAKVTVSSTAKASVGASATKEGGVGLKKPEVKKDVKKEEPAGAPVKTHRGSSVSEASPEEIKAVEKKLAIQEEDEDDDEDEDDEDEDKDEDDKKEEDKDEDDDEDEEDDDDDEDDDSDDDEDEEEESKPAAAVKKENKPPSKPAATPKKAPEKAVAKKPAAATTSKIATPVKRTTATAKTPTPVKKTTASSTPAKKAPAAASQGFVRHHKAPAATEKKATDAKKTATPVKKPATATATKTTTHKQPAAKASAAGKSVKD